MAITRRNFVQRTAALAGVTGAGVSGAAAAAPANSAEASREKRKHRTIYFNDARHYYLFVYEPPMSLADAWSPIDEVAGTSVDTFVYGVARSDGLFYPSKVGQQFGADIQPFEMAAYWRIWENMQSLAAQGHDPLKVLIDRAHSKGMDFFASLRMSAYGGMDPAYQVPDGRGLAHKEVRDHQFEVLKELMTDYETEGVELDFAAAPGGMPPLFRPEDVAEFTPVLTEYVREISSFAKGRSGRPAAVGARVYPTEAMCRDNGLDVWTWLSEGLVDYLVPLLYLDFTLDPNMPIDWLIRAAHEHDVPVYGMIQPYAQDEATGSAVRIYAEPEVVRAAAANYWARGVDGLYAWFLSWPLGPPQRQILSELGDKDLIVERSKRYVQRRRSERAVELGYDATLPIKIPSADSKIRYSIPFDFADDLERSKRRVRQVTLKLRLDNLVSADKLTILLNGKSLAGETCLRTCGGSIAPYRGQWLEFHLTDVRPVQGSNLLEISLDARPPRLEGGISVEECEVRVEYGPYPSSPRA